METTNEQRYTYKDQEELDETVFWLRGGEQQRGYNQKASRFSSPISLWRMHGFDGAYIQAGATRDPLRFVVVAPADNSPHALFVSRSP